MRYVTLCLIWAGAAWAQTFSVGVIAGVPTTNTVTNLGVSALSTNFPTYVVGPTVQVSLFSRFAIAVDGLYSPIDYYFLQNSAASTPTLHTTGSSWEFPVTLKYSLTPGPVHAFVEAGGAARLLSDLDQASGFRVFQGFANTTTGRPVELQNRFAAGFTFGGGVDMGVPHFHFAPEFRYTRWGWDNFVGPNSNLNQVEFLVGFRF